MDWTAAIGIDTHKHSHLAVALDRQGRRLGSLELEVTEQGFRRLLAFARSLGEPAFVVEGTGSYGASLARFLASRGLAVYECERPARRGRGAKSDLLDAERAASRLVAGESLALPRTGAERERLRLLLAERRSCQRARLQAKAQLAAALVGLDPGERERLAARSLEALARLRRPWLAALARLARRILALERELAEIDRELAALTGRLCPGLLQEHGVGPLAAAQLVVSCAQPGRLRSEAAFAALAGVSPLEASSGLVRRHRLNRGGDRQLNRALHMSALTRIAYHAETRAYYGRLLERGKTRREAIRCVKRVLARRLYRIFIAEQALPA
jgi:transposase